MKCGLQLTKCIGTEIVLSEVLRSMSVVPKHIPTGFNSPYPAHMVFKISLALNSCLFSTSSPMLLYT